MTCCTRLAPCEDCCNRGRAQLAAKLAHFATRGMVENFTGHKARRNLGHEGDGNAGIQHNVVGISNALSHSMRGVHGR